MTNQELLFYAAKAHGGLIYIEDMGWIHEDAHGNRGSWWHPLDDSKDAFDLAVMLKLQISTPHEWFTNNFDHLICTVTWRDESDEEHWKSVDFKLSEGGDAILSTRRAITEAAAEIGKNMQNNCDVSGTAMERARYAMDKVKYSSDKNEQINLAAQALSDVAVMIGTNQK